MEDWKGGDGPGDEIEKGGILRQFADYSGNVGEIGVAGVLDDYGEPDYTRDSCAVKG